MFIIAEEKTQPHAADSGIQAEVVSSWLAPTYQIGRQRPRQVVDSLQKQWVRSQLYEWSEGPKGPDLHLQALYAAKAQTERRGRFGFSASGHAFIDSGHPHQPIGPASARENRSTRPTHP